MQLSLSMRNVTAKSTQPRYRELAETLMAEIQSGRMKVGDKLPGEIELSEQHGVSRHTVRESLRVLEELGLIDRSPRLGTTIKAQYAEPDYVHRVSSPSELMSYPAESRLTLLTTEKLKLNRALARELSLPSGSHWVRLAAVRRQRGSGQPICWSDIYVLPAFKSVDRRIGRSSKPVYAMLEEDFDVQISGVEVEICAAELTGDRAEALNVADGSSAIRLIRRYRGRDQSLIEVSVTDHPANQFSFNLAMQRGWRTEESWPASE